MKRLEREDTFHKMHFEILSNINCYFISFSPLSWGKLCASYKHTLLSICPVVWNTSAETWEIGLKGLYIHVFLVTIP